MWVPLLLMDIGGEVLKSALGGHKEGAGGCPGLQTPSHASLTLLGKCPP